MSDPKKPAAGDPSADAADEKLADLAAFVLAGRPERVEDGVLMMAAPEFRSNTRRNFKFFHYFLSLY